MAEPAFGTGGEARHCHVTRKGVSIDDPTAEDSWRDGRDWADCSFWPPMGVHGHRWLNGRGRGRARKPMITDPDQLEEVRKDWAGVEALVGKLDRSAKMPFAMGGLFPWNLADAANNLPMLHAFGVLNDVLRHLRSQGCFKCKSTYLGPLVKASKDALCWEDYDAIKKGIRRRNDVAHDAEILPRAECWELIGLVRSELSAWGVI